MVPPEVTASPVGRYLSGRVALLGDDRREVVACVLAEPEFCCLTVEFGLVGDGADELPDRRAQFGRASLCVADPEREAAGLTECG